MKNVLLTTTALVAFAGAAAAADVALDWSGEGVVEYDVDTSTFSADAEAVLDVTLTQELNDGAVASLTLSAFADWDLSVSDEVVLEPSWVAMVETSYGSISAGDIDNVNSGTFSAVAGMDVYSGDDHDDADDGVDGENIVFGGAGSTAVGGDAHMVRADTTVGGFAIAASSDEDGDFVAVNATGSAGGIDFGLFYEQNLGLDTVMGATASGDFNGLGFAVAYASDDDDTSTGISLSYALTDAITVSGSHAINSAVDDQTAIKIAYAEGAITASVSYDVDEETLDAEASYTTEFAANMTATLGVSYDQEPAVDDVIGGTLDIVYANGDNWAIHAGANTDEEVYAGIVYDLGGGATAYAYYADGEDLGPEEWTDGTVLGLKMTF